MCKRCSYDIGAGFKNKCKCKCHQLTYVDTTEDGDVYGCKLCNHLMNGFAEPNEEYEDEEYIDARKLVWTIKLKWKRFKRLLS